MTNYYEKVLAHLDPEFVIELARSALRIPSLSGEEKTVAEFFANRMEDLGMEVELQFVPQEGMMHKSSYNAIGRLKGEGNGSSLMFNGHIDHNPVCDGWTRDPFGGIIEDGWLYGFVHMKAANAAYVAAIDAVRKAGIPLRGDVILAHVCGELMGGAGTKFTVQQGLHSDYFVVGEPTELELCLRHTASILFKVHTIGRMKHFATLEVAGQRGINAIEKMMKVVQAVGPSHTRLPSIAERGWLRFEPVPGFERLPQLNIGNIQGGISRSYNMSRVALLPDFCTIAIDVRLMPGMSLESVREDLDRLLSMLAEEDEDFKYEIEVPQQAFIYSFMVRDDSPIVTAVKEAHRWVTDALPMESTSFVMACTDASWLTRAGMEGIVYGPTGKFLSRPNERGRIEDIVTAARVYACLIVDICTRSKS